MTESASVGRDIVERLRERKAFGFVRADASALQLDQPDKLCKEAADTIDALREALKAARWAIGDHHAPNDCYATGPMTGDQVRDLVICPACVAIPLIDAALGGEKS